VYGAVVLIDRVDQRTALVEPPLVVIDRLLMVGPLIFCTDAVALFKYLDRRTACSTLALLLCHLEKLPLLMPQHDVPVTYGLNAGLPS